MSEATVADVTTELATRAPNAGVTIVVSENGAVSETIYNGSPLSLFGPQWAFPLGNASQLLIAMAAARLSIVGEVDLAGDLSTYLPSDVVLGDVETSQKVQEFLAQVSGSSDNLVSTYTAEDSANSWKNYERRHIVDYMAGETDRSSDVNTYIASEQATGAAVLALLNRSVNPDKGLTIAQQTQELIDRALEYAELSRLDFGVNGIKTGVPWPLPWTSVGIPGAIAIHSNLYSVCSLLQYLATTTNALTSLLNTSIVEITEAVADATIASRDYKAGTDHCYYLTGNGATGISAFYGWRPATSTYCALVSPYDPALISGGLTDLGLYLLDNTITF